MTIKARVLLLGVVVVTALWSTGCGHYDCGITKGNTTCSSGGSSSTKSGGGNGNQPVGNAYAYVADPGGIQGYTLVESSTTLALNCTPTTCPTGVPDFQAGTPEWAAVSQKNILYVEYSPSSNLTSSIFAWTIAPDGSLTDGGTNLYPFNLPFQTTGGAQAMIEDPAGTHLFMIDSTAGNPQIDVYQIGSSGGLTAVGVPLSLPSGFVPYNLAMDGLGKYLYVSNVVGSSTTQIVAYSNSNGVLTAVPGSPFSSNLIQMQGDPSGKYLIGTTATLTNIDANIYVLGITQSGANAGAIAPLASAATVKPPNSVVVQPNSGGTLVYSFNISGGGLGGNVEGYTLNLSTGALTVIGGSPFSIGADAGQFDQAGQFLFARDLFGKFMTVFDVTADPTLATPVGSQTWDALPWAWAVTDPN